MITPAKDEPKILSLDALEERLKDARKGGTVVLCNGAFEMLHGGYLQFLQEARRHGDVLVVTLTPDRHLPSPPPHPMDERARARVLAALEMVDYVAVGQGPDAVPAIRGLKPDCFVQACPDGERLPDPGPEADALKETGGRLVQARIHPPEWARAFVNPLSNYSPIVAGYLEDFAARHTAAEVGSWLRGCRDLKVLVVGEAIIDEYHYCETMGKSGKEPILATRFLDSETFAGGILAVANNVASFSDHVTVLTVLGRPDGVPDPSETFIRAHLKPGVETVFLYQDGAPTILKRRYVEKYPLQKLFEVYHLKHMDEESPLAGELCRTLEGLLPAYDVVIVTDYGHGLLVPGAVAALCAHARFLAVNTQSNADNHGFNTISKYPRADFVSLSEKELRLEARSRHRDTASIMTEVGERIGCRAMLITRGSNGNLIYSPEGGVAEAPSLSDRILDRVGAGDAVLAATALCVAQGAPPEVVGFLGNLAGAHAVAIVGHRSSLDRDTLVEHLTQILG